MEIERWDFSLSNNDQRLQILQNPPPFEEIVKRIKEEMDILCCHADPCQDYSGFERVAYSVQIPKDLFDLFFNSRNGYRASYYRSPFEGMEANRLFVDTLLPVLCDSDLTSEK
jgi:hypothetical protein